MEEMNENWENCCPLCMEEMDSTDRQLKPCRCGYQICVWCWNHIMEMAEKDSSEGRCPACRTPYDREKIVSTAVRLGEINDKKQKPTKAKAKASEGRKNLSNVRVIQRNLVYVVGIPAALADEETLERKEYFGQYGKILKISVSKTGGQNSQHLSAMSSVSVYVTYVKEEDAMRCIQSVNGYALDGKTLKACFGTTKYCNAWLKHMPCNNPDCLYLHDEGMREDSFTKEEMLAKYGSKNQHFHDLTHPPQRRIGVGLPPPIDASFSSNSSVPQNAPTFVGSAPKTVPLVMNLPKSSSLPAAASWGSRPSPCRSGSGRSTGSLATKPKTGAGFMNSVTVSESCTSGQCVSNHEGIKNAKSSNTGAVHISLSGEPRFLERNHSSAETTAMIRAETFPSDADDVTADSRKLFDGLPPHRKSFTSADNTDHAFATGKDTKTVDHSFSHNFADAEESTVTTDSFAGGGLTKTVPTQDACLKSPKGLLASSSVDTILTDQKQGGSELYGSFQSPSMDCNSHLLSYPNVELSSQKSENALQAAIKPVETHNVVDKSGLQRTNNVAVSLPSNVSSLNALLRLDHPTTEACEDISCNWPLDDNWSSSVQCVNSDEPPPSCFLQDETTIQSTDSLLVQNSNCKTKAGDSDGIQKASINGLSEHELISDMFSRGFDLWSDGNPQDLAQLLFDGKNVVFPSTSALQKSATVWKPSSGSGSKQSRFHFARQDEINEQTFCANKVNMRSEHEQHLWSEKDSKPPNGIILTCLNEVSGGKSYHPINPKNPMMAPPGFSSVRPSAIAPPGFSQLKATDLRRSSDVIQDPLQKVTPASGLNHFEATDNSVDVEFIDPAIMAVGKGKLPTSSRITDPFSNSPLSALLSQTGPLSQQPKPTLDFEPIFQAHQDRSYRSYGYSNQDLDASSSLFHSSFNDTISQSRLMGQYHDGVLNTHVVMPESLYANGAHGASKPRFQHSSADDWSRLSDVNRIGQQSVSDAVGRLTISQLSLDRAYQNRLEELSLSKDMSSKFYGDAAIPTGYDEQGPLSSARIGRYFLGNI